MKRLLVEIGRRFQSVGATTGAPLFTYEVQAVFRSTGQIDHARLVRVGDWSETKTLAVSALLNRRHFVALPST